MGKKTSKKITAGGRGQGEHHTIVLQPTRRVSLDIAVWLEAIRDAEVIDNPRRAKLVDLYKNVSIDGHLFAVLRKQRAAITAQPIQFLRNGKVDEAMQEHIKSPWFFRFIGDLVDHEWYGVGGSLFQFYREDNGWINYQLIDRRHVDPINRLILRQQGDQKGESWDNFTDLLYIGNPRQLGDLAVAAFWVILKRNNAGDWAELGEIFGRPIREGTYDPWDDEARIQLMEDLVNAGGSQIFIHPTGTTLNLKEAANLSGGTELYSKLHAACNAEISKIVNSNTLTTEAGERGTQALGKVQSRGEDNIEAAIKRNILNILNYEVTDVFAAMGINTDGGEFVFAPQKSKDFTKEIEIDVKLKNVIGLPMSDDYFYEKYGIDKPDNYEELVAKRDTARESADSGAGKDIGEVKTGLVAPDNKQTEKGFFARLYDFFTHAPKSAGADLDW